jgi:hypothetical protein
MQWRSMSWAAFAHAGFKRDSKTSQVDICYESLTEGRLGACPLIVSPSTKVTL